MTNVDMAETIGPRERSRSSTRGALGFDALGIENGSHGLLVAFDVDEATSLVEGERTGRQAEKDRGVSAHDGI